MAGSTRSLSAGAWPSERWKNSAMDLAHFAEGTGNRLHELSGSGSIARCQIGEQRFSSVSA